MLIFTLGRKVVMALTMESLVFQAEGGISYYQLQNNQPILLWSIDSVDNPGTSYIPY